jgi:hypothetical protein
MKKIIKRVFNPLLGLFVDRFSYLSLRKSPNLFKLAWYTLRFKVASKGFYLTSNEHKLASLKDSMKGKRCFIIGNGPSLNDLDLTLMKGEYTFGVNAIYLNYEKMQFHPTYYVVEDYLVAEDRAEEINKYDGPKIKFFGTFLDYVLKADKNTVKLNVIVNYEAENFKPFFAIDCARKVGVGGSVTYICLQLAYHMGFESVYMIGFDHHYTIPNDAATDNTAVIESKSDDPNHFAPGYFGKGYRWHDPNVSRMEEGFKVAGQVFEAHGRKVYNATKGGKLEVFERKNYVDLF